MDCCSIHNSHTSTGGLHVELAPKAAPRIGQLLASNEALLSTAVPRLLQPEPITGADP